MSGKVYRKEFRDLTSILLSHAVRIQGLLSQVMLLTLYPRRTVTMPIMVSTLPLVGRVGKVS